MSSSLSSSGASNTGELARLLGVVGWHTVVPGCFATSIAIGIDIIALVIVIHISVITILPIGCVLALYCIHVIYTYKRVVCVCLSVGLSAFYRPHDICPLCGAASEWPRAGEPSSRAAPRARAQPCTARARARMPYNFSTKKIAVLMPFKNKTVRARACCRTRNCRDFHKKGERKPTCHFPSSVYSLPSLGVCTFRIVRIVLDLWSEPTLVSSSIPIKE